MHQRLTIVLRVPVHFFTLSLFSMKRFTLLRLSCVVLLGAITLSSCEQLNITPKKAGKDCKTKTASDSTNTGGVS